MKYVILLHGLGSNKIIMKPIEWALSLSDLPHKIINVDFSSFFSTYINIINEVSLKLYDQLYDPEEIIFVGHSLGGMVAADISKLFINRCKNIKCITLGTPYKGAILADTILKIVPICNKYIPIVRELTRQHGLHINHTNIPHHIIIGTKKLITFNPLSWITNLLLFFEYEHDGVVDLRKHDFDNIMNKRLYFIDGVDHVTMIFNDDVNRLIIDIIKRVDN